MLGRLAFPPYVTPEALMVPKAFFGHMIQGSIVNRDGTTTRPITIPIGTLRMWDTGAVWYYIGDREPYNWDGFEGFIALGQRLGAELLYTFGRAPVSQRIPGTMVPTNQNWQRFVWMVAERASGRVKCWEMWNEPAVASMYWAGGTIAQLLAQSRSGYRIIKSLETDAIVLTPSFNELGSYGGAFAANYLTQMRNLGAPSADAVAFHSYAHTPEGVIAELNILRSLMAGNASRRRSGVRKSRRCRSIELSACWQRPASSALCGMRRSRPPKTTSRLKDSGSRGRRCTTSCERGETRAARYHLWISKNGLTPKVMCQTGR